MAESTEKVRPFRGTGEGVGKKSDALKAHLRKARLHAMCSGEQEKGEDDLVRLGKQPRSETSRYTDCGEVVS